MKQTTYILVALALLAMFIGCGKKVAPEQSANNPTPAIEEPAFNTLTGEEQQAGWVLLFDGQTLNGWRNFGKQTIGKSWQVQDGAIYLNAQKDPKGGWQAADGGDITTDSVYGNFELQLEWKIAPCGNSGIIYRAVESGKYRYAWETGPEMQVLDNACHPDAKIAKHRAGDFYDVVSSSEETVKPAGEWNQVRIVAQGNRVEHWLNGVKVVEVEMGTDAWKKLLQQSKWKSYPDFSTAAEGHIVLQDHGDPVWYRNIKIRRLE